MGCFFFNPSFGVWVVFFFFNPSFVVWVVFFNPSFGVWVVFVFLSRLVGLLAVAAFTVGDQS